MSSYKNFLSDRLQLSRFIYLFECAIRSGFSGKSFYNKLIKPILETNSIESLTSFNESIEKQLLEATLELPDLNFDRLDVPPRVRDEMKSMIYKELEWVLNTIYDSIKSSAPKFKSLISTRNNQVLVTSLFRYLLPQIKKYFSQIKPEIKFKGDKSSQELETLKTNIKDKQKSEDDLVKSKELQRTFVSQPKIVEPMSKVPKSNEIEQFEDKIKKATNKFEIEEIIRDAEEFVYMQDRERKTFTDEQIENLRRLAEKPKPIVTNEPVDSEPTRRSRSGRSGSQVKKDVAKLSKEEKAYYDSLGRNATLKGKFIRASPEERRRMMGSSYTPVQRKLFSTNENYKLKNLTFKSFFDYID